MSTQPIKPIKFTGHKGLANRLVLATLRGQAIHITNIRSKNPTSPGLAPHEISLLRLLEALTNGSHIEISYTGTTLLYKPGLITGSVAGRGADAEGVLRHEVDGRVGRGISYLVLAVCLLAPFSKAKVNVLFTGQGVITSAVERYGDVSVDTVRTAVLPTYAQFGIERDLEIRVIRRSNPSNVRGWSGGGEVQVVMGHQVRVPTTIHMLRAGRVKRVRGVAYATGVSGGNNARMIEVARGVLNEFVPDTYIYSDTSNVRMVDVKQKSGDVEKHKVGLGFGISLVAEGSGRAVFYSADAASGAEGGETPEEVGRRAAYMLLESISHGGAVSDVAVPSVLMLMSMGTEDVGRVNLGRDVLARESTIQLARDLSAFGAPGWGIREVDEIDSKTGNEVLVTVVGSGIGNVGRKIG